MLVVSLKDLVRILPLRRVRIREEVDLYWRVFILVNKLSSLCIKLSTSKWRPAGVDCCGTAEGNLLLAS